MKRSYFCGMLDHLMSKSAHPDVAGVEDWHGLGGGEWETGRRVRFGNGAELFFKIVGASGPGGGHSGGPDVFDPADVPGDVSSIGGDGPYRVGEFAAYLVDLLRAAGHAEIVEADVVVPITQTCVGVRLADGHRKSVLFVRAVGPGGRRAGSDYQIAEAMA